MFIVDAHLKITKVVRMKALFTLLLLIPSLSWGSTFKNDKSINDTLDNDYLISEQTLSIIFIAKSISFFFTFNGGKIRTTFSAARIVNNLLSINFFINFV